MDNTTHFDYLAPSQQAGRNEMQAHELATISRIPIISAGVSYGQEMPAFRHDTFGASSYSLEAAPPLDQEHSNSTSYWTGSKFSQEADVELRLHAPIPVPGCAPILREDAFHTDDGFPLAGRFTPYPSTQYQAQVQVHEYSSMQRCDYYNVSSPPSTLTSQSTFLTPSELLVELSGQANEAGQILQPTRPQGCGFGKGPKPFRPELNRAHLPTVTIPDSPQCAFPPAESQSSETITSHEKKRHYLECLEQYIAFLHEHSRRVGIEPVPLERFSNYRCLNSRSIRSLLIHMEKTTKQMQERIYREEQKFLRLREALQRQESVIEQVQGIHH